MIICVMFDRHLPQGNLIPKLSIILLSKETLKAKHKGRSFCAGMSLYQDQNISFTTFAAGALFRSSSESTLIAKASRACALITVG